MGNIILDQNSGLVMFSKDIVAPIIGIDR